MHVVKASVSQSGLLLVLPNMTPRLLIECWNRDLIEMLVVKVSASNVQFQVDPHILHMQFGQVVAVVGRQSKIDCNHLLVSRPLPQLTDLPGCEPSGSNCPFLAGKEELLDFHSDSQASGMLVCVHVSCYPSTHCCMWPAGGMHAASPP